MGRAQHHPRRGAGFEGFLPASRAQAPLIARTQPREGRARRAASTGRCRTSGRIRGTPPSRGYIRCGGPRLGPRCCSSRRERSPSSDLPSTTRSARRTRLLPSPYPTPVPVSTTVWRRAAYQIARPDRRSRCRPSEWSPSRLQNVQPEGDRPSGPLLPRLVHRRAESKTATGGLRARRGRPIRRLSQLAKRESGGEVHDDVDDQSVHHGRAGRNADEAHPGQPALSDFVGDSDGLVVGHAHRFGQLAQESPGAGPAPPMQSMSK